MKYAAIWSLKRGCIDPPEEVDAEAALQIERAYVLASLERDPPLTQEQRWREEGQRSGFMWKRRKVA